MNVQLTEKKSFSDYVKSNLKTVIGIAAFLLLIIVFFVSSNYLAKKNRIKLSEDFVKAKILIENKKDLEALELLRGIIGEKDSFYSPLSLFIIIDKNLEKNENNIKDYFNQILSANNLEKEDLNLLKLKKAIYISESSEEKEILDLLNPIVDSNSVWKPETIKFLGDYYFSVDQLQKAKKYYLMLVSEDFPNIDINKINKKIQIIENE